MALRCSPSPPIIVIQKLGPIKKPLSRRVLMIAQSHVTAQNTPLLEIRSSFKNKVFEDLSKGIVCYRDENGEITCEGYDEGPRFYHQQLTILACSNNNNYNNSRDANKKIIDLLNRSWLQIVDGGSDKDDAAAAAAAKCSTPVDSTHNSAN